MEVAAILDFVKMLYLTNFSKIMSPMLIPVKYNDNRLNVQFKSYSSTSMSIYKMGVAAMLDLEKNLYSTNFSKSMSPMASDATFLSNMLTIRWTVQKL